MGRNWKNITMNGQIRQKLLRKPYGPKLTVLPMVIMIFCTYVGLNIEEM
jgi:hypothetical protein